MKLTCQIFSTSKASLNQALIQIFLVENSVSVPDLKMLWYQAYTEISVIRYLSFFAALQLIFKLLNQDTFSNFCIY